MNILPLVCGFILIFGFLSATFLRDHKMLSTAERSLASASLTQRHLLNEIENRRYKKLVRPKKKKTSTKKAKTHHASLRSSVPPEDHAKLNIALLFTDDKDPKAHPIYKITLRLLDLLYRDTLLKDTSAQEMLEAMLITGKSVKEIQSLTDLFPQDPNLQRIYYTMLKGTNRYSTEAKTGIPPLTDFLVWDEETKKDAIHFCFASPMLLEATFGQKLTALILSLEQGEEGNYEPLKKSTLESILLEHHKSDPLLALHLNFTRKPPVKTHLVRIDPATGLSAKKRLRA